MTRRRDEGSAGVGSNRKPHGGNTSPALTVVTCVESGPLEAMAIRMVESLRRFGGVYATSDVVAVTVRRGPPLARETRERFADLGVRYVRSRERRRYGWYHFLNKPLSLIVAEQHSKTDLVAWLDADTLVMAPPTALGLAAERDFGASAPDIDIVGSTGPGDPFEPSWQEVCRILDVDIDALPYLTTHVDRRRIRLYWQGGVFVYRISTNFAHAYLQSCLRLLDANIVLPNGAHWLEQMAIGLAMFKLGLRWIELPWSHNYAIASYLEHQYNARMFRQTRILHYHDSMAPYCWEPFLSHLEQEQPDVYEWLQSLGPLRTLAPLRNQVMGELLRIMRGLPRRIHRVQSRVVGAVG